VSLDHEPEPAIGAAARWLRRHADDSLALLGHGAAFRGETLVEAPIEFLLVLRRAAGAHAIRSLGEGLQEAIRGRYLSLDAIESFRLGWMPPCVLQQSLLSGATLLWGSVSALRVIPAWRPEQIDPRDALVEIAVAERDLAEGRGSLAMLRAAGALLVARRAYTARLDDRAEALARAWPEAPDLETSTAPAFVREAAGLVRDWLFTWERDGFAARGVEHYVAMWREAVGLSRAPGSTALADRSIAVQG
jgi:hypothetical protein